MTTERDAKRIVQSWLEDGSTALPDRVLDAVLAELPSTPQRRSGWSPRRSFHMATFLKLGAVAAVIVVAVVAGITFLPARPSVGGPGPAASPSLPPGAFGGQVTFPFLDSMGTLDLLGTDDGTTLSGTAVLWHREGNLTIELECIASSRGAVLLGGHVTANATDEPPVGTDAAVIVVPSVTQRVGLWIAEAGDPPMACPAFLATVPQATIDNDTETVTGGRLVMPSDVGT